MHTLKSVRQIVLDKSAGSKKNSPVVLQYSKLPPALGAFVHTLILVKSIRSGVLKIETLLYWEAPSPIFKILVSVSYASSPSNKTGLAHVQLTDVSLLICILAIYYTPNAFPPSIEGIDVKYPTSFTKSLTLSPGCNAVSANCPCEASANKEESNNIPSKSESVK